MIPGRPKWLARLYTEHYFGFGFFFSRESERVEARPYVVVCNFDQPLIFSFLLECSACAILYTGARKLGETPSDSNALLTTNRQQNGDEFKAYIGFCNIDISVKFPNGSR